MKTINYLGGVVQFQIPIQWKEEYSDVDGGTFYDEKPDSGTFRLKIITAKSPSEITNDSAVQILGSFRQTAGKSERLSNANALAKFEELSVDRGHKIKILYWMIANPIPPDHARIATFSYTILESKEHDPQTIREIEMFDREVRTARFSSEIGVTPK